MVNPLKSSESIHKIYIYILYIYIVVGYKSLFFLAKSHWIPMKPPFFWVKNPLKNHRSPDERTGSEARHRIGCFWNWPRQVGPSLAGVCTRKVGIGATKKCVFLVHIIVFQSFSEFFWGTSFVFEFDFKLNQDNPPNTWRMVAKPLPNESWTSKGTYIHETTKQLDSQTMSETYLVGGWPTPLKNIKVSWDDYSQYMEKKCSKPPTR